MKKLVVYIDVERMKYKNIGLYTFCNELIKSLSNKNSYKYFGFIDNVCSIKPKWYQKLFGVKVLPGSVWHATHQDTDYLPSGNTKIVLTIHDLNFLYTNKSEKKKLKKLYKVQKLVDRSSAIVVISNYVLNDVKNHIELKGKPISVIYNGTEIVDHDISNITIKEENFLFTLGTVVPKKNFHVLLSILVNTDYTLLIAGILPDSNYLALIKDEAKKLGVTKQLKILGPVSEEEKQWYYTNCKAFLFPSLSEGFGLPVIEAMRYGKPVFCSNLTSLPEIGGDQAYYFESFNKEHMQNVFLEGMIDFNTKPNKAQEIISWSSRFTWEKTALAYEAIYKSIV